MPGSVLIPEVGDASQFDVYSPTGELIRKAICKTEPTEANTPDMAEVAQEDNWQVDYSSAEVQVKSEAEAVDNNPVVLATGNGTEENATGFEYLELMPLTATATVGNYFEAAATADQPQVDEIGVVADETNDYWTEVPPPEEDVVYVTDDEFYNRELEDYDPYTQLKMFIILGISD